MHKAGGSGLGTLWLCFLALLCHLLVLSVQSLRRGSAESEDKGLHSMVYIDQPADVLVDRSANEYIVSAVA
jgi:hypothetical protein